MTIRITKTTPDETLQKIVADLSGVDTSICLSCKKCSAGCPVSAFTHSSPAEIIKRLQLGASDEVLADEHIWVCASCQACYARCPMKINSAAIMDALRMVAQEKNARRPAGNMPLMNALLLKTIELFGRTYDIGAMALYKARTATYFKDTGKFPAILKKGKIALLPPRGADRKKIRQIFKHFRSNKG